MSMRNIIFNGELVPYDQPCIRSYDRGFTLGDGFFETMLAKKGAFPALSYHWRRLTSSAELMGMTLPFSLLRFESMLQQLIECHALQEKICAIRVTISRGESERGILPSSTTHPNYVVSISEYTPVLSDTFTACIVTTRKNELSLTSRIKSLSYLDNILAKQEAVRRGFDEGILLNTQNWVADGTIANIFVVKDGAIMTPSIDDGALPGVIRSILLEEFSDAFVMKECSISKGMLFDADEIFMTNALMGVRPVSRINDRYLEKNEITKQIKQQLIVLKNYI